MHLPTIIALLLASAYTKKGVSDINNEEPREAPIRGQFALSQHS